MSNYKERAEKALWQAENAIGTTPESQARLFLRAQVYATFHLAEVSSQTQSQSPTNSEQLDALQQAYDHLKGMYDQMAVRYARLLDGAEKVVNDLDEEKVVGCDHLDGGEIPYPSRGINVWLWFTYCPKCGVRL